MIRLFLAVLMISGILFSVSLGEKTKKSNKVTYKKIIDLSGFRVKSYIEVIGGKGNRNDEIKRNKNPRSCLDHLKNGETETKVYTITTPNGPQQVFCDLSSGPGSAWTLVLSHQMEYRDKDTIAPFKKPLTMNLPVNEKSPNYNVYRMTLAQMTNIKSNSTHWRVTCNGAIVDYRDYLRVRFAEINPLTFIGIGVCKKVEYINVRGHVGIEVTVPFWQLNNKNYIEILHHDSNAGTCSFGATPGNVFSEEDNFGLYRFINRAFRCSASDSSTSNMWFGAYL